MYLSMNTSLHSRTQQPVERIDVFGKRVEFRSKNRHVLHTCRTNRQVPPLHGSESGLFDGCLMVASPMAPIQGFPADRTTTCCGFTRNLADQLLDGSLIPPELSPAYLRPKFESKLFKQIVFASHFLGKMRHKPVCRLYV